MKAVLFSVAMFLVGCRTPADVEMDEARKMTNWRVALTSSGGFAGRGNGAITASSTGGVTVTDISGKSSTGDLTAEERDQLAAALGQARPAQWVSPEPPHAGADMFEYTLEIERDGEKSSISWREDVLQMLPADAGRIHEILMQVRERLRRPLEA